VARADSTIAVHITGDSKDLGKAVDNANTKMGKLGGGAVKLGGLIAGAFAVDAVFDFAKTALDESDRVGDALAVLQAQLGTDITTALDKASTGFHELGLSRGDVLELETAVADMATALGLSKDNIAELAPDLVTAAGAISLITDKDPSEVIDLIGKAAGGSGKALKELGIALDPIDVQQQAMADTGKTSADQLTKSELAAARYKLIMEKLAPKIQAVTDTAPDLEASQKEMQARWETLTGQIGDQLAPVIQDIIHDFIELGEWLLDAAGAIGDFGSAAMTLAADITANVMGVMQGFVDIVGDLLGLLGDLLSLNFGGLVGRLTGATDDAHDLGAALGALPGGAVTGAGRASDDVIPTSAPVSVTINVPPTGAQTEAAVVKGLRDYQLRNGALP